jgi:hypothetical protein
MSDFDMLFFLHPIFDWLFQPAWMGYGKLMSLWIRFIHCSAYAFGVSLCFAWFVGHWVPIYTYLLRCGWGYETGKGSHNWDGSAHRLWLSQAKAIAPELRKILQQEVNE